MTNGTDCVVRDGQSIRPFPEAVRSYSFKGSCEHVLIQSCNGATPTEDFAVAVDFLSSDLNIGAVGASLNGGQRWVVSYEDGRLVHNFDNGVVKTYTSDTTDIFNNDILVNKGQQENSVAFVELGVVIIHSFASSNHFIEVTVSPDSNLNGKTCGLCGSNLNGELLFRNQSTVFNIMDMAQATAFANSWLVEPSNQILRDLRSECGL